jgi:hypothetical protein
MYAMKVVASSVFRMMMFPHNGKIITIDQVSHYEPNPSSNIDNILPLVHTNSDAYPLIEMGPRIFKDPSLLGTYHGAPPLIHPSAQVCVISSDGMETGDTIPPTEASSLPDIPLVTETLPQEPPENPSTPLVPSFTLPQGHIPVWETVPQAITQIPFFYPPPGVQYFQVAAMLTLPNMVLSILVWYLHPPEMVPQPSLPPQTEGIPMQIPVLTLTTPPSPPLANTTATAGGRWKKKDPTTPLPPRVQPPCALCEKEGHPTNRCPSLPELRNLIQLPRATTPLVASSNTPSTTTASPTTGSKGLRTKFACAICSEYGHYTHHFPVLPQFRQMLMTVCQIFQQEPPPSASSSTRVTDIHYVTTSVNEWMRFPFSLCESLDHFTYQCPTIIEYRHRQMALIQNPPNPSLPAIQVIPPTPSPDIVHILSPEPEALPTPPWFMDNLYEDFPPNPPNSLVHFPMEILRPTTIFNPQYLDIWFMSSNHRTIFAPPLYDFTT